MTHPVENFSFYDKARETRDWSERKTDLNRQFLQTLHHAYDYSNAYRETQRPAPE